MPVASSPLRYPGGKASLTGLLAGVMVANGLQDGTYVEPYAGGAGAALNLLFGEHVQYIVLNDADPSIYAFWDAVLNQKDEFVRRLREAPVNMDEWRRQRDIYRQHNSHSRLEVAFATFFLNRCNRSGILAGGGPIGGVSQAGKWRLDARFNKDALVERIEKIHLYRDRIEVHNLDAIDFLRSVVARRTDLDKTLVYLDPPYYVKGKDLYLNYYRPADHATLASFIQQQRGLRWIMTYDDVPQIRLLYAQCAAVTLGVDYSAHTRKRGHELLIRGANLVVPDGEQVAV